MAIREKRFLCGKYLEVEIYPISKYEQNKSRSKKKNESRKEQKNLNDKNAKKNLRRRIHANFDNKDLIVSLSYDVANLPNSEEDAIRDRNNYIRRIKNFRKRNGLGELKYIAVLEYREATDDKRTKTRIHHHIIISGMDRDKVEELWGKGISNTSRMQANELGFEELANYLLKDPRGKKRWSQSKNIVIPVPDINDYKYSNKKLYELSRSQGEREVFEKLYPGFGYSGHEVVVNDIDGGIYVYVKMRRFE